MTAALLVLVVWLAALGKGCWIATRLRWPAESIPLFLATSLISALYLAGLVGLLTPVAWLLVAVGWVALAGSARDVLAAAREARWRCPPGLVVFAAASTWLAWRLRDAPLIGWDAFSHWGLVSSEIAREGALVGGGGPVIFREYPPGAALFHFHALLGSGFSEGGAHGAQALLACSALVALTAGRGAWVAVATFVVGYAGVFQFSALGFQTVEVDHLLALLFGCGLGAYHVSTDPGRVWRLVPVAFALPLMKRVGPLCATFLVLAVVCDQLLLERPRRARRAALLLLALAPLLATASWRARVAALEERPASSPETSLARATRPFSAERATERDRLTLERFSSALDTVVIGAEPGYGHALARVRFTAREWGLAFLGAGALLLLRARDGAERRRFVVAWCCSAAFAVAFAAGLLHAYLHTFTEYEGARLMSFGRYMGTVVFALVAVTLAWATVDAEQPGRPGRVSRGLVAATTLLMVGLTSERAVAFALDGPAPMDRVRVDVRRVTSAVEPRLPADARVFVIAPGSRGHELHIARYELAPRVVNRSHWSVGSPRSSEDVYTAPLTNDELRGVLAGWTHVLLLSPDEVFWREHGELFTRGAGPLYRVVSREGRVELEAQ